MRSGRAYVITAAGMTARFSEEYGARHGTGTAEVVVNRSMSLDGFIAGPGDAMDWIFDFMGPIEDEFPEIMAATGAMLIGRRIYEVAKRMADRTRSPLATTGELSSVSHPRAAGPAGPGGHVPHR